MKIAILGGSGNVGSHIVKEALTRQHDVTAIGRSIQTLNTLPKAAKRVIANASNVNELIKAAINHDVLISAVRPPSGHEKDLVLMTESALHAAMQLNIRLLIVGGAARLKLKGTAGDTVLTANNFLPKEILPIARACQSQYELCVKNSLENQSADWAYLSPPAMLFSGERTGQFRRGLDTLLVNDSGQSTISYEDFAVAMLDETETPTHKKSAFTVAY